MLPILKLLRRIILLQQRIVALEAENAGLRAELANHPDFAAMSRGELLAYFGHASRRKAA